MESAFVFGGPSQEDLDRARMEAQANIHAFHGMLDRLTKEELVAFGHVLSAGMENPSRIHQLYGQISAYLRIKFNSCSCGTDHMSVEELIGQAGAPASAPDSATDSTTDTAPDSTEQ